jgi:hypothetical protein
VAVEAADMESEKRGSALECGQGSGGERGEVVGVGSGRRWSRGGSRIWLDRARSTAVMGFAVCGRFRPARIGRLIRN